MKNIWFSGPKAAAGAKQTQEMGPWRTQVSSLDPGALKINTANYSKGASGMDVLNGFAYFWSSGVNSAIHYGTESFTKCVSLYWLSWELWSAFTFLSSRGAGLKPWWAEWGGLWADLMSVEHTLASFPPNPASQSWSLLAENSSADENLLLSILNPSCRKDQYLNLVTLFLTG